MGGVVEEGVDGLDDMERVARLEGETLLGVDMLVGQMAVRRVFVGKAENAIHLLQVSTLIASHIQTPSF